MISDLLHRLRAAVRHGSVVNETEEELLNHPDHEEEEHCGSGISGGLAACRAQSEFDGVGHVKEEQRSRRGLSVLSATIQDLHYGLRLIRKSRMLTVVLAVTLALGIGVNTAIFSVLNGWLFRPLPVRAPEQIMVLAFHPKEMSDSHYVSYLNLQDFQKQATAFSDVFAYAPGIIGFSINGRPSEFAESSVTGNYFSALGVKPALGRLILPGEGEKQGEQILTVLSYGFWQRRFGGNPSVIGQRALVNGKPATIIGVTPREFRGTFFAFEMDGYLSLNAIPLVWNFTGFWTDRGHPTVMALGRLAPGVSLGQAQSSADLVAARLAVQYPDSDKGATVRVIPERLARPAPFVADFVPVIAGLFMLLPALVLLLACLNVANILLARANLRRREMAIRAAVGAGRMRLIRQMLTESLLLAVLGGLGGMVFGEWAIRASGSMLHSLTSTTSNVGYGLDCSFDWRVFAYTLGAAVLAGIFVGIWPAVRAGRVDVNSVLHESGRSDSSGASHLALRSLLLVGQVAGSLTLLIVAGLFVRSLGRADHMYLGFDPDHVLIAYLDAHQVGYDEAGGKTFYRELEHRLRALPAVESASIAYTVPLGIPGPEAPIYIKDRPVTRDREAPQIYYNGVDPNYFESMRVPLLAGRQFKDSDDENAPPAAIVNQTMARMFWPNEDPVGKRFSLKSAAGPFVRIVGVARDGQGNWMLTLNPQPFFYVPFAQNYRSSLAIQVRTSVPPEALIAGVRKQIHDLAPDLPIIDIRTMQQAVHGLAGLFIFRLAASLAGVLGIMGLALATVGVYGVISFTAAQRTHEIGIRMALGATAHDILAATMRQGLILTLVGIGMGLVGAFGLGRLLRSLLFGVKPGDPVTFLSVSLLLFGVALLANFIPAQRATRVDPMVALHHE